MLSFETKTASKKLLQSSLVTDPMTFAVSKKTRRREFFSRCGWTKFGQLIRMAKNSVVFFCICSYQLVTGKSNVIKEFIWKNVIHVFGRCQQSCHTPPKKLRLEPEDDGSQKEFPLPKKPIFRLQLCKNLGTWNFFQRKRWTFKSFPYFFVSNCLD